MSILALDYGSERIGLALVPEGTTTAVPLVTIPNSGKWNLRKDLEHFIKEHHIKTVVIGLPLSMSGETGPQAATVQTFVDFLRDESGWDIQTIDERMSTQAAARFAKEMGIPIDSAAAVMIAQAYVDRHSARS